MTTNNITVQNKKDSNNEEKMRGENTTVFVKTLPIPPAKCIHSLRHEITQLLTLIQNWGLYFNNSAYEDLEYVQKTYLK